MIYSLHKSALPIITLFALFLLTLNTYAQQAGNVDPSFNPMDKGFGNEEGHSSEYLASAIQPDGKILIGSYGVYPTANRLHRLNTDGSIDSTFNIGSTVFGTINRIIIQPDNKIIVSG